MTQEKKGSPILRTCLVTGLVIFLLVMCSGVTWIVQVPFYLVAGWIFYLKRTIPEVAWNWEAIASGVAYLVFSVVGFHLVAKSIAKTRDAAWAWKRSVCVSVLFLMIFGTSLAIGGIAHQVAWLARVERWTAWGGSHGPITKQISNARQLILSVRLYASDEGGRYPSQLYELLSSGSLEGLDNFEKLSAFTGDTGEPPAPWIYVRGLSDSAPEYLPMIIAPHAYKSGKRIIGTNDTSVELMKSSAIREALPKWKAGYAALGIPLPKVLEEYDGPEPVE